MLSHHASPGLAKWSPVPAVLCLSGAVTLGLLFCIPVVQLFHAAWLGAEGEEIVNPIFLGD